MSLLSTFSSMSSFNIQYKTSGTGALIVRIYDGTGALFHTSAALTSLSYTNYNMTTFGTATFATTYLSYELECRGAPGDTVHLGALTVSVNAQ